jgi:hypothetical protein
MRRENSFMVVSFELLRDGPAPMDIYHRAVSSFLFFLKGVPSVGKCRVSRDAVLQMT